MNDYSQRMSANNDGMCPDWKPDLEKIERKNKYIDLQYDIVSFFEGISEILNRHKDINWETHQISFHITKYNLTKIKRILDGLEIDKAGQNKEK